jgi:hypothetical protein
MTRSSVLSPHARKLIGTEEGDKPPVDGFPFSGMVSFRIHGGFEAADRFLMSTRLFSLAESLRVWLSTLQRAILVVSTLHPRPLIFPTMPRVPAETRSREKPFKVSRSEHGHRFVLILSQSLAGRRSLRLAFDRVEEGNFSVVLLCEGKIGRGKNRRVGASFYVPNEKLMIDYSLSKLVTAPMSTSILAKGYYEGCLKFGRCTMTRSA